MTTSETASAAATDPITDLCFTSATELAGRIRRRELSPVELVDAYLTRIDRCNEPINAYVTVLAEQAGEQARIAEREVMSGRLRGALHGVPIAIKDLFDFKQGVPNTFGVEALAEFVPEESAPHVVDLEGQGAIVLGKTNTPEFAHKGTTDNKLFGPTSTPFDPSRNAGGSSGGSAAAVAAGLCALAQGSDGGGSVRIPASLCGVVGLKPSFGRVADVTRPDAFIALDPFMGNGPLARTVEDCALLFQAMAGRHDRDPGSVTGDGADFVAATRQPVEGLRAAYLPTLGGFPVDPGVRAEVDAAVSALEAAGIEVVTPRFDLPGGHTGATALWLRLAGGILVTVLETFAAQGIDLREVAWDSLPPQLRATAEAGYDQAAVRTRADQVYRTEIYDAIADVLDEVDLILSPTVAVEPFENAEDGWTVGPTEVAGEAVDPLIGWCLTHPFNFTGHPAISVPAGFTSRNLPVGLQIAGRRFADEAVLAAAAALERARPWRHRYGTTAA